MRKDPDRPAHLPILSQTAEHALRAALYLGRTRALGPVPATDVAEALGAPANYLAKTLRHLVREGILGSTRGPHGGFQMLVDPADVSLADILAAIEGPTLHETCLLGDRPCDRDNPCKAHARWVVLTDRVRAPLEETTLADLLVDEDLPDADASAHPSQEKPQ